MCSKLLMVEVGCLGVLMYAWFETMGTLRGQSATLSLSLPPGGVRCKRRAHPRPAGLLQEERRDR